MLQSDIQVGTLRSKDLEEEHSRKKEAIRQAEIEKVWKDIILIIISIII